MAEEPTGEQAREFLGHVRRCPHGDPTCPCQDGDWCHYEDDPATGTKAEDCSYLPHDCPRAGAAVLIGTLAGVAQAKAKRRRR